MKSVSRSFTTRWQHRHIKLRNGPITDLLAVQLFGEENLTSVGLDAKRGLLVPGRDDVIHLGVIAAVLVQRLNLRKKR